jgi:hypothetical protein
MSTVTDLTPPMQLLCALCSSGRIDPLPLATTLSAQDWDRFWQLALRHRVGPIVTRALRQQPAIQIPEHIQAKMHRATQQNALKALRNAAELVRLTHLLETAQIRFVTFKGIALTQQMGLTIQERHVGDIDLLLADKDDIWRADALILQAGYQRYNAPTHILNTHKRKQCHIKNQKDIVYFNPTKKVKLEIHHRLLPNRKICNLETEKIWQNRSFCTVGNTQLPCMNINDHRLYLLLHGAISRWFRLKWLYDIPKISRNGIAYMNLDFLQYTEQLGIKRMIVPGIYLAHELLNMPISPEIKNQYINQSILQRLTKIAKNSLLEPQPTNINLGSFSRWFLWYFTNILRYNTALKKELSYKMESLKLYDTNIQDWHILPLPDTLFFLYYPLRPILWLCRRCK